MVAHKLSAFLLGNSSYDDAKGFPSLPHCGRDAERLHQTLTSDTVGLFDRKTSVVRYDLTLEGLNSALSGFFAMVHKRDTVLLYFACHGKPLGERGLSLIMRDTKNNNLAGSAFSVDRILDFLEERDIRRHVLIFDCCRAGRVLMSPRVRNRGEPEVLNFARFTGTGKWVIAACREFENAHEVDSLEHGLFTRYLIDGIESGKSARPDLEYIDVQSVVGHIEKEIEALHPDLSQVPVYDGKDLKGEPIYIARNPSFEPGVHELLLESSRRVLQVTDLATADQIRESRRRLIETFLDKVPKLATPREGLELITTYGAAIDAGNELIAEASQNFEARVRFAARTPLSRPSRDDVGIAGRALMGASARGEHAYSFDKGSIFGEAFFEGLSGNAAGPDGNVSLQDLYDYVVRRTTEVGQTSGIEQTPSIQGDEAMFRFQLTTGVGESPGRGRRRALLFGTDTVEQLASLPETEAQLRRIAGVLEQYGQFEATLLLGSAATTSRIHEALNQLISESYEEDSFLVYFSGHAGLGSQLSGSANFSSDPDALYLMVSDSKPELFLSCLDAHKILHALSRARFGSSIVVLDTSYAGNVIAK